MASIRDWLSGVFWKIDTASQAGRVTLYNIDGTPVDESSPVKVGVTNTIDASNTSIIALTAGATFTGTGVDISNYNQLVVNIFGRPGVVAGDGSSAMGSLFLEFSKDNSNWDISIPSLVRDPSLVIPTPLIYAHKYFRVRYLNDGGVAAITALGLTDTAGTPTTQTVFRLTTYLLPLATKELARTMDQSIQGSDSAVLVKAGIMGKNPLNSYVNRNTSGLSGSNNSTAILGAGASFTGVYEEVLGYQSMIVNVDSDLTGMIEIQFSQDGTNISTTVTRTFTNISVGQGYSFIPIARYVRVKFTNTAGTQTYFRLQTIFKSEAIGTVFVPINTPLVATALAQVVLSVSNDGVKTTYSASIGSFSTDNLATDIFTITGSATETVRIISIFLSAVQTTASSAIINLIKRSTANSGGTSASVPAIPHDSNSSAATATVLNYTVNPTLGTTTGNVRARRMFIPSSSTASEGGFTQWPFGSFSGQSVVLRGVTQVLAVNLGGVTITGDLFSITVEWTEE